MSWVNICHYMHATGDEGNGMGEGWSLCTFYVICMCVLLWAYLGSRIYMHCDLIHFVSSLFSMTPSVVSFFTYNIGKKNLI